MIRHNGISILADGSKRQAGKRQSGKGNPATSSRRRRSSKLVDKDNKSEAPKKPLENETISYLIDKTRYTEPEIREWYEGFSMDCPDGKLRKQKVVDMYTLIMPDMDTTDFVDEIFRIFDRDGNGSIDFVEFMLATDMTVAGTAEEKLAWVFKGFLFFFAISAIQAAIDVKIGKK